MGEGVEKQGSPLPDWETEGSVMEELALARTSGGVGKILREVGEKITFEPVKALITTVAVPEKGVANPGTVDCSATPGPFVLTEISDEEFGDPPPPPARGVSPCSAREVLSATSAFDE